MLSTQVYDLALKSYIENSRSAMTHGDTEIGTAFVRKVVKLINYCSDHGLTLDVNENTGLFYFKLNGYTPSALHITSSVREGATY